MHSDFLLSQIQSVMTAESQLGFRRIEEKTPNIPLLARKGKKTVQKHRMLCLQK